VGTPTRPPRKGRSVRWLLLSVGGLILLVPVLAVLLFRVWEFQLLHETEAKLMAEGVLVGEVYRALLAEEEGRPLPERGDPAALLAAIRPPAAAADAELFPWAPLLDEDAPFVAPVAEPLRRASATDGPAWRAGRRLGPLLDRARRFNLSGVQVVDPTGCVVATTNRWLGQCLDGAPELATALAGRYAAVLRDRVSDEPPPAWDSISRRGSVRVYVVVPVVEGGRVLGAVRASRTSLGPLEAAWLQRRPLLLALALSVALTLFVSLYVSRSLTRPLREITAGAEAIARGAAHGPLVPHGSAPAEIHALGRVLTSMKAQLEERAAYVADFAANVSHELKTPITSIVGAIELLRDEGDDMPLEQRQRFLANIDAGARRMQRLVARLLQLARIEHAPSAPPGETAERLAVRPALERLAAEQGPTVRLTVAPDAPEHLAVARDHFDSAVRNLLENAVRHGAGQPVDLEARAEGGRLVIAVRDRGHGISPANQAKLFQRFFTTERDAGGTGLGLAIVQAVARSRGGTVRVETGPHGSTFTLVL
jgi:signal transduction histidine kinase